MNGVSATRRNRVKPDEIGDPLDLRIRTYVSGELRQDGYTADMLFNIYEQVSYLSSAFTLEPGVAPWAAGRSPGPFRKIFYPERTGLTL